MSEFGYIPEAPTQSWGSNKGIFTPNDIYDLTRDDKFTDYGQLDLIETQSVSSVSQVDFTNLGTYNVHFLTSSSIESSTTNVRYSVRFYESGVLETASVYQYATQHGENGGTFSEQKNTGDSDLRIGGGNGNDTNEKANGYVYIYNAGNSIKYTFITTQNLEFQNTVFRVEFGGGVLPQASVVDGIRLKMHDAGNISGTTKLYGVKQL